jgi:16S rRNA (guanine527-N7)-methyltransferase
LSEYCLPFVNNSGFFISYKSGSIDDELTEAGNAISILGGQTDSVEKFSIPGTDYDRSLIFIKKIKGTDKKYPRKAGTPQRKPL